MDHFAKLVAASLLFAAGAASATFATPSSPAGFSMGTSGPTLTPLQQLLLKPGSTVLSEGPRVAGSGPTKAAYKLGAGAARALARAAIAGTGTGAVALGAIWLADNCISKGGSGLSWTCAGGPGNQAPAEQSDGREYRINTGYVDTGFSPSKVATCQSFIGLHNGSQNTYDYSYISVDEEACRFKATIRATGQVQSENSGYPFSSRLAPNCPAGWYITPQGCVYSFPPQTITAQQAEDHMASKPLPSTLPSGVPYPVEIPWFNPKLDGAGNPVLDASGNPQRQPLVVPQGDPQKVPDTDPPKYRQPVTTVTQSPTAGDPWRMNVEPGERITTDPQGMTQPGTPGEGDAETKPKEDPPSLCEQHPEILACADLDTPESGELETKEMGGPITPDSGWGASNAACPAAKHIVVQGRDVPIPFDLFCTYMSGIRPIILAMAWLAAAFIFVGGVRSND